MNKSLILALLFGLAACSNRGLYDNMQLHQRNECLKQPPAVYEECMARAEKSYEEYKRERDAVLAEE